MNLKQDLKGRLRDIRNSFHDLVSTLKTSQPDEKSVGINSEKFDTVQTNISQLSSFFPLVIQNQNTQGEINTAKKELEGLDSTVTEIIAYISQKHVLLQKTLFEHESEYENAKNPKYLDLNQVLSYSHSVTNFMSAPIDYPNSRKFFAPAPQPDSEWSQSLLYPSNLEVYRSKLDETPPESIMVPTISSDFGYKFKTTITNDLDVMDEVDLFDDVSDSE